MSDGPTQYSSKICLPTVRSICLVVSDQEFRRLREVFTTGLVTRITFAPLQKANPHVERGRPDLESE